MMQVKFAGWQEMYGEERSEIALAGVPQECRWTIKCVMCARQVTCVGARALELQLLKMSEDDHFCSASCWSVMHGYSDVEVPS